MNKRILILTEGKCEVATLEDLLRKASGSTCCSVLLFQLDPYIKDDNAIKRDLNGMYKKLHNKKNTPKRYDKVILLLDFEKQGENGVCLVERKQVLERYLSSAFTGYECTVVFKLKAYENWIVADAESINKLSDYKLSKADIRQIRCGADNVNAYQILVDAKGTSYHKLIDSKRIVPKLNPLEIEKYSRSFRKLLKEISVPKYDGQSSKNYRE